VIIIGSPSQTNTGGGKPLIRTVSGSQSGKLMVAGAVTKPLPTDNNMPSTISMQQQGVIPPQDTGTHTVSQGTEQLAGLEPSVNLKSGEMIGSWVNSGISCGGAGKLRSPHRDATGVTDGQPSGLMIDTSEPQSKKTDTRQQHGGGQHLQSQPHTPPVPLLNGPWHPVTVIKAFNLFRPRRTLLDIPFSQFHHLLWVSP